VSAAVTDDGVSEQHDAAVTHHRGGTNVENKKVYGKPEVTVHGTLEQLTQQTKNKFWGDGDDVLVQNQPILSNS
jgi:hypothetical protein